VIQASDVFSASEGSPVIYDPEWSAGALLAGYFKMLAEAAGLEWTDGHTADIFRIVEYIGDGAMLRD
jgi:hypothetical protein